MLYYITNDPPPPLYYLQHQYVLDNTLYNTLCRPLSKVFVADWNYPMFENLFKFYRKALFLLSCCVFAVIDFPHSFIFFPFIFLIRVPQLLFFFELYKWKWKYGKVANIYDSFQYFDLFLHSCTFNDIFTNSLKASLVSRSLNL